MKFGTQTVGVLCIKLMKYVYKQINHCRKESANAEKS
jgi:hypothetical protein